MRTVTCKIWRQTERHWDAYRLKKGGIYNRGRQGKKKQSSKTLSQVQQNVSNLVVVYSQDEQQCALFIFPLPENSVRNFYCPQCRAE